MLETFIKAVVALVPVLFFLAVFVRLDSHRLISLAVLARVFVAGASLTILVYLLSGLAMDAFQVEWLTWSRVIAPALEESLKAGILIALFRRNQIGFQVDAALFGFAVGAGFSFAENLHYLYTASDAHHLTWVIRGFGTAIMHGGCAALFAVTAQIMTESHQRMNPLYYLPGLIAAILLHAIFNLFPVSPILSAAVTVMIIPLLLYLLFEKNDVTIHNFLEQDFDLHRRLLNQLDGGPDSQCATGEFVKDIQNLFRHPVNQWMRDYIHLHTELILSAESVLMARETGAELHSAGTIKDKIQALHQLEKDIGKAGMHTLSPHLRLSPHELWLIHIAEEEAFHPH